MLVFITWSRISCHASPYTIFVLQVIDSLLLYESTEQWSHGLICMYAHFDNLILYSNIFRHRSRQRPMFCWHRQPSCLYHHIHNQPCPHPPAVFPFNPPASTTTSTTSLALIPQPPFTSNPPAAPACPSPSATTPNTQLPDSLSSPSASHPGPLDTEGNFYAVEEILAEKQVKRVSLSSSPQLWLIGQGSLHEWVTCFCRALSSGRCVALTMSKLSGWKKVARTNLLNLLISLVKADSLLMIIVSLLKRVCVCFLANSC